MSADLCEICEDAPAVWHADDDLDLCPYCRAALDEAERRLEEAVASGGVSQEQVRLLALTADEKAVH